MQNLAAVWFPPVRETRLLFKLDQRDISCLILCISMAVITYVPLSCSQSAISSFRHTHTNIYVYIFLFEYIMSGYQWILRCFFPFFPKKILILTEATYGMKKRLRAGKRFLLNWFCGLISWGLSFFFLFSARGERDLDWKYKGLFCFSESLCLRHASIYFKIFSSIFMGAITCFPSNLITFLY